MSYKTVKKDAFAEIEIKKSRFIAHIAEVKSEEEAEMLIKQVKKKYYDASHNCSAYILNSDQGLRHSSDDGEPSGTAGKPMLDVIAGAGLVDVIIIVTRYFGGTELGTGGLVRAYSGVAAEVIKNSTVVEITSARLMEFVIDYGLLPKLQHLLLELGIIIYETEYLEKVKISVLVTDEVSGKFFKELTEITAGAFTKDSAVRDEQVDFYLDKRKVILDFRG
ncbi:MAG: YigZ family protein [Catonella sp.]|uniref:YigZ family protein n=1 Tax=Catonella sp. TaxID=2382125 RepID=UPI003FA00F80